jgi:hypothetical protein
MASCARPRPAKWPHPAAAKALEDAPTSERWNDWAVAQAALGRADKAEVGFRRALTVDAGDTQAATSLGLLLLQQSQSVPMFVFTRRPCSFALASYDRLAGET